MRDCVLLEGTMCKEKMGLGVGGRENKVNDARSLRALKVPLRYTHVVLCVSCNHLIF